MVQLLLKQIILRCHILKEKITTFERIDLLLRHLALGRDQLPDVLRDVQLLDLGLELLDHPGANLLTLFCLDDSFVY